MSVPRQITPSQSPTPSKSSIRRTSGNQNPSQRSLLPPPSPRFEDDATTRVRYSPRSPPNQTLEYDSDEDDLSEEEARKQREKSYFPSTQERTFQPFFTLIEDGVTSEHHHPSVHYLFADDDHDVITEAALRSLGEDELDESKEQEDSSYQSVKEHYLVLDVHPQTSEVQDEYSQHQPFVVSSSASLSPEWQIIDASILLAPTLGETTGEDGDGLMLRIEGRSSIPEGDIGETDNMEQMMQDFQQGLKQVRSLMKQEVGCDFEEQD